jgi:hypothetical protein
MPVLGDGDTSLFGEGERKNLACRDVSYVVWLGEFRNSQSAVSQAD